MTAKSNILEGLHVLLVSEDEARVTALAKALRDRKASVGDVKVRSRDALALRGADLVVVDTRSPEATKAGVNEMRADVRARWASIAALDYAKLVLDDGAVMLASLETEVAPLVSADKELTERARTEESFSVSLRPLGPSRMLRALAAAGPTMHVEIFHATLSGSVDLSNELLVCAFAERGGSEKWEAWAALVRILGLTDATVHVSRKSHPSAMNIMEPIDQALEVAAQERHSAEDEIAMEERSAQARVSDDPDRTAARPALRADGTLPEADTNPPRPAPAFVMAQAPKRTLLGVAAPAIPAVPDDLPALAKPKAASRYNYRGDGNGENVRPSPSRTLLGVAPGALPALGAIPRPVVNLAVPNMARVTKSDTVPTLPVPANTQTDPQPATKPFVEEQPTSRHPVMLEVARAAFAAADDEVTEPPPSAGRHEARTVRFSAVDEDEDENRPTTLPPDELDAGEPEETLVASSRDMRALREESGRFEPVHDPDLMPLDDDLPADLAAPPPAHLLDAIGEEVATAGFSNPPGAQPIPPDPKKPRVTAPSAIARFVKKPRTLYLLVILLLSCALAYFIVWTERRTEELEARIRELTVVPVAAPSPAQAVPAPPAPAAAPGPLVEGEVLANDEPGEATPPSAHSAATAPAAAAPAPAAPAAAAPAPAATPPAAAAPAAAAPAAAAPAAGKPAPLAAAAPEPVAEAPVVTPPEAKAAAPAPSAAAAPAEAEPAEAVSGDSGVDALVRAGSKLLAMGNAKGAREQFDLAIAADPKNSHARGGLAEALFALGQHRDALFQIEEAIKLRPRRVRYRVVQGDLLQALGKTALANEAWKKALEIDPADRDAQKRLNP